MEYNKIQNTNEWKYRLIYDFTPVVSEEECPRYSAEDTMKSIEIYLTGKSQGDWKIQGHSVFIKEQADAFAIRLFFYDFLVKIQEYNSK